MAVARLSSSVPEISQSGFLYAYMHMIAECGMLYVQAAKAQVTGMESTSSATMLRTMENISILLEHLGSRGRESYLSESAVFFDPDLTNDQSYTLSPSSLSGSTHSDQDLAISHLKMLSAYMADLASGGTKREISGVSNHLSDPTCGRPPSPPDQVVEISAMSHPPPPFRYRCQPGQIRVHSLNPPCHSGSALLDHEHQTD